MHSRQLLGVNLKFHQMNHQQDIICLELSWKNLQYITLGSWILRISGFLAPSHIRFSSIVISLLISQYPFFVNLHLLTQTSDILFGWSQEIFPLMSEIWRTYKYRKAQKDCQRRGIENHIYKRKFWVQSPLGSTCLDRQEIHMMGPKPKLKSHLTSWN